MSVAVTSVAVGLLAAALLGLAEPAATAVQVVAAIDVWLRPGPATLLNSS